MRRGSLVGEVSGVSLDRYIPRRRGSSHDLSHLKLMSKSLTDSMVSGHDHSISGLGDILDTSASHTPAYNSLLSSPGTDANSILNISPNVTESSIDQSGTVTPVRRQKRTLPKSPERIFDMPNLRDDYYSSPFSWSAQGTIGVALIDNVYSWHFPGGPVRTVSMTTCDAWSEGPVPNVTAVTWDPHGRYMALGTETGATAIWDSKRDKINLVDGGGLCEHDIDVQALVWIKRTPFTILYGVKGCGCIRKTTFECEGKPSSIKTLTADMSHEVSTTRLCGVAVCPLKRHLVYSSSTGDICVLNLCEDTWTPHIIIEDHVSTVKALSFCPWQPSLLASGGGSRDGTIQGHKVTSGAKVFEIPSLAQVCNLVWSPETKELISGHGMGDLNIYIWSYPTMDLVGSLQDGQMGRVLGLGISPDGCTLASLTSEDESLRLWVIAKKTSPKKIKFRRNSLQLDFALPGSPLAACIR